MDQRSRHSIHLTQMDIPQKPRFLVFYGLIGVLFAVSFGSFHIISGSNLGFPMFTRKPSFSFSETFINLDQLEGMPCFAVQIKYPLSLKTLQRLMIEGKPLRWFAALLNPLGNDVQVSKESLIKSGIGYFPNELFLQFRIYPPAHPFLLGCPCLVVTPKLSRSSHPTYCIEKVSALFLAVEPNPTLHASLPI